MAAFTVCAKLAAMNVRMAIGAMRAYILENQACVAFGAGHFLVHAAQWITRAVMIKLGIRPDRFPARVGMAVLARHGDGAVRIRYFGLRATYARTHAVRGLLHGSSSEQGYQSNKNRSEPARTYHRPLRVIQGPALGYDLESPPLAYTGTSLPETPWTTAKESTSLARADEVSQLARCKFTDSRASRNLSRRYGFYRKLFARPCKHSTGSTGWRGFPLTGIQSGSVWL